MVLLLYYNQAQYCVGNACSGKGFVFRLTAASELLRATIPDVLYPQYPWFAVGEAKTLALVDYSTRMLRSFFVSVKGVKCSCLGFGNILRQVLC